MKLSLILDESFKDTLITIVDECVKMKFNNIECQYSWSQTSFVYDVGEIWVESYMWVGHSSKSYNLDELYVYCNSKRPMSPRWYTKQALIER
jgi:hypothetical protein